jgi:serine O-acetyltransferase
VTLDPGKLRECFTVDLEARSKGRPSLREALRRLIFNPGFRAVVYYRIAVWLKKKRRFGRITTALGDLILVRIYRVPGLEIRTRFEIGPGLLVDHPHDIVLGAGCRVGRCVTIYNGVTLGARTPKKLDDNQDEGTRYPTIEDGVTLFSGAKVIGPVTVGRNSIVGANSVVTRSFPADSIIAGAPARQVGEKK